MNQENTSGEDTNRIINLKIQHWPHPFRSQKDWILKNINSDDYNLLLEMNSELVGFLNLIHVDALLDNTIKLDLLGVGNVCVSKEVSGKGLGLLLMQIASYHIKSLGYNGVLLCSDDIVPFYIRAGWLTNNAKVSINDNKYDGMVMFLNHVSMQKIELNRNF